MFVLKNLEFIKIPISLRVRGFHGLGVDAANLSEMSVARVAKKKCRKTADSPSWEQSRTLCVFFKLKGGQLLIFPDGISVIRYATHGVIYASRSYERGHGHWTRITRPDPLLPCLLPRPYLHVLRCPSASRRRLSVSIFRELSHSFRAGPEKSNEALVGSTNMYCPRDP